MSKKTQEKKEAKLKGKQAKTAASQKSKPAKAEPKPVPAIPNADRCCHCRFYKAYPVTGHYCAITGKPTPRKATCSKNKLKA